MKVIPARQTKASLSKICHIEGVIKHASLSWKFSSNACPRCYLPKEIQSLRVHVERAVNKIKNGMESCLHQFVVVN